MKPFKCKVYTLKYHQECNQIYQTKIIHNSCSNNNCVHFFSLKKWYFFHKYNSSFYLAYFLLNMQFHNLEKMQTVESHIKIVALKNMATYVRPDCHSPYVHKLIPLIFFVLCNMHMVDDNDFITTRSSIPFKILENL